MPNKSYIKGANNERELVNKFRRDGDYAVRTAGSKSAFDVIHIEAEGYKLIKSGNLNLIQVKSKKDRNKVKKQVLPEYVFVNQYVAYKDKGKWVFEELKE